jgi:hypothetical protein
VLEPPSPSRPGSRLGAARSEALAGLALGGGLTLLFWAVAAWSGSLTIPHNDAWGYDKVAFGLAETGRLELVGWNRPALVGLWAVEWPFLVVFGASFVVTQSVVAAFSVLGLASTWWVLRWFLSRSDALVGVLLVAVWPGYALLATSSMAEVPAMALATASLALGLAAVGRGHVAFPALAGSLVIGFWAVTVRDQSIAAPLAVGFVALVVARDERTRWRVLSALVAFATTVVAFEFWRRSLPHADSPTIDLAPPRRALESLGAALLTGGVAVAPLLGYVAAFWSRHRPGRASLIAGACVAAPFALAWGAPRLRSGEVPRLVGNYFAPDGAYTSAAWGARPMIVPDALWMLVIVVAVVGATVMVTLVVDQVARVSRDFGRRARGGRGRVRALYEVLHSADPGVLVLVVYVMIMVTIIVLQVLIGGRIFDRYLLPLWLPLAVFAARLAGGPARRGTVLVTTVGLTLLAVVSALVTLNAYAFDRARWRTAERLVAEGMSADDIDAGIEWLGWNADEPLRPGVERPPVVGWWDGRMLPGTRRCAVVAASRLQGPGLAPLALVSYRRYLIGLGPFDNVVVHVNTACRELDAPNHDPSSK